MCSISSLYFIVFTISIHTFTFLTYFFYYSHLILAPGLENESFDYIIVGSGTAGSLIAQRLLTETNYTFLLIEAGGRGSLLFDIPALGPLLHGSVYDWQYETVPQDGACLAMHDQRCKLPQGKITGGSARLNNMISVRGSISQYVDWFNGKYNSDYFRKHFEFLEKRILPVNNLKYESRLASAIMEAANELNYENLELSQSLTGFMKSKVNQRYGRRWTTFHTFRRNRYRILTHTEVIEILMYSNIAYGVEFVKLGRHYTLYAQKGIIIAAGALNSPKLLQLSGIGPEDVITRNNITLLKDLPVGKNLQDHVTTGLDLVLFNESLKLSGSSFYNPLNIINYFLFNNGPLTSPGCEVVGFLSTKNSTVPNVQFMVLPVGITADQGIHLRKSLGIRDDIWDNYFSKIDTHSASILPILLYPKSRGSVMIRSDDYMSPPLIDPNYLSAKEDFDTLFKALLLVLKFIRTDSMKKLGAYLNPNVFPGCENFTHFSKPYWECYVRHLTLSTFHPVGTCKMGLRSSPDSVVDTEFKVIGIGHLYVVDASVLPNLPIGNINTAVAMMANIFFETNIATTKSISNDYLNYCTKLDYLHEILFQMCIV